MEDRREIVFEIPFHIRAPDGFEVSSPQFFPRVRGFPLGISFKTETHNSINLGGTASIRRDRYGALAWSSVRVTFLSQFDQQVPNTVPDKGFFPMGKLVRDRDGIYIETAVRALNKFLRIYREETGAYWIRPLEPGDIGEFEIRDFQNGDLESTETRPVARGGTRLGGMNEEVFSTIEHRLESESAVNTYQILHLDIQDSIDAHEYDVAILLAYILFERWVKRSFILGKQKQGATEQEARDIIMDNGQYESLSNILLTFYSQHLSIDFKASPMFDDWKTSLNEVRNNIVHTDYSASKADADSAHRISLSSIEWLQEQLEESVADEMEAVDFVELREMQNVGG